MDFSFSDLNLQHAGRPPINFNSVETLPSFLGPRRVHRQFRALLAENQFRDSLQGNALMPRLEL